MSKIATTALLLAAIAAAQPSPSRAEDSEFADRVGTLVLDTELDSRGQLGGMAVDKLGFLYVANFRDAVWRISPEGHVETLTRSLYGSSGIAVDASGDLYQSNFFGNTITRIRRTGEVERFADSGLNGPVGIAIDSDGTLFVCNCSGNRLSRVTPDGAVEDFASSPLFACPNGIVLADDGNFYVTNFNHNDLLRVTPEAAVEMFANTGPAAGNAHLVQSKGFFYVTKLITNRLVKVSPQGTVTALAGTGQSGSEDGPALAATFNRPNAIAVSPTGDRLYVNTVIGQYQGNEPSSIGVRTIDLTNLRGVLESAYAGGGMDAAEAAYQRYRSDPLRSEENTVSDMVGWGYSFLSTGKAAEAIRIFRINATANPQDANSQYQLGEAFRYSGQTEEAIAQYRLVLEIDPAHANAASRLAQLKTAN